MRLTLWVGMLLVSTAAAAQQSPDRAIGELLRAKELIVQTPWPAAQMDSDGDGVVDADDLCPGTQVSARVAEGNIRVPIDACGCPVAVQVVRRQDLDLKFEFASARIDDRYHGELDRLRELLLAEPQHMLVLEGHTDSVGSADYNQGLSQMRAEAVRRYLIRDPRLAAERVRAVGFGESKPISSNETDDGRQANRRTVAEFRIERQYSPSEFKPMPQTAQGNREAGGQQVEESDRGNTSGGGAGGGVRRIPDLQHARPPVRRNG